jgi:uncharacterized protein (TIGR04255 family)
LALPKKISPNPIFSSAIEIKFSANLKSEEVLNKFFPLLSKEFPNNQTKIIRNQDKQGLSGQSGYSGSVSESYVFTNDEYLIGVSKNLIMFDHMGEYTFWDNYYAFIKKYIKIIGDNLDIKSIERVGVRYVNVFDENVYKTPMKDIINPLVGFSHEEYSQIFPFLECKMKKNDISLKLRFYNKSEVTKSLSTLINIKKVGGVIDVDSYSDQNLPSTFGDEFITLIDTLHTEGKKLIFNTLLKHDFIQTLTPEF